MIRSRRRSIGSERAERLSICYPPLGEKRLCLENTDQDLHRGAASAQPFCNAETTKTESHAGQDGRNTVKSWIKGKTSGIDVLLVEIVYSSASSLVHKRRPARFHSAADPISFVFHSCWTAMLSRRDVLLSSVMTLGLSTSSYARPMPTAYARYVGSLVLVPQDDGRLMKLDQTFGYFDSAGTTWAVPKGAVVDGASIPRVLWSVVGGPWEGQYRAASVVHDWFCAVRIMPWRRTHRMFYDAMLTSRVEPGLAKLMFLAVRYAGPSWDDLTLRNSRILSNDGRRRLSPPGPPSAHGFATDAEAGDARTALLAEFRKLSARGAQADLSPEQIEDMVDHTGRAEDTAALLS